MEYITRTKWKEFHYPKPPKGKIINEYKLVDVVTKATIIEGNYALCKFKQKQLTIKTKIQKI
jgi:hypothetical protein